MTQIGGVVNCELVLKLYDWKLRNPFYLELAAARRRRRHFP